MRPSSVQVALFGLLSLIVLSVIFAFAQPAVHPGRFEFDVRQPLQGLFRAKPVPALWVLRRYESSGLSNYSMYPLVGPGRHGLSNLAQRFDGGVVTLEGKLIYNRRLTVIETEESSIQRVARAVDYPEPLPPIEYGEVTLRGETIDIKSYAGYQEPGFGSLLISPASNAIRGGVPAVLVMKNEDGGERAVLLLNERGESLGDGSLGWVSVPVELQGQLESYGGLPAIKVKSGRRQRLYPWNLFRR